MHAAQPIHLVRPGELPASLQSPNDALYMLAIALGVLGMAVLIQRLARRRPGAGPEPGERAMRVLCRCDRLDRHDIRQVRRLAARAGIPPASLLLSEGAFMKAVQRTDGKEGGRAGQPPSAHERLRRRLFQSTPPTGTPRDERW